MKMVIIPILNDNDEWKYLIWIVYNNKTSEKWWTWEGKQCVNILDYLQDFVTEYI